ncbi:MAG TPA: hypothetical protein VEL76_18400 [Gemmataceae bacterium]|nr:hypothetical protein [Gemmataceae bacterium]
MMDEELGEQDESGSPRQGPGAYYPWIDDPDKDEEIPGHGLSREEMRQWIRGLMDDFRERERQRRQQGVVDPPDSVSDEELTEGLPGLAKRLAARREPPGGTPVPDEDDDEDLWQKVHHPQWGYGRLHLLTGEEEYGDELDLDDDDRREFGIED